MALMQSELHPYIDLSTQEMQAISQAISRDFAPRFLKQGRAQTASLAFSVQELLAISQEISRDFAPRGVENRANLVLLPLDPQRLHAYWQLPESNTYLKTTPAEHKMNLRIFSHEPQTKVDSFLAPTPIEPEWFDIAIDPAVNSQQITLPVDKLQTKTFSAAIGPVWDEQGFTPMVYSKNTEMPNSFPPAQKFATTAMHSQSIQSNLLGSSSNTKLISTQG